MYPHLGRTPAAAHTHAVTMTCPFNLLRYGRLAEREAWQAVMGPDCFVRVGNGPIATSRDAGADALASLFTRFEPSPSGFCDLWRRREALIVETELRRRDGSEALLRNSS